MQNPSYQFDRYKVFNSKNPSLMQIGWRFRNDYTYLFVSDEMGWPLFNILIYRDSNIIANTEH